MKNPSAPALPFATASLHLACTATNTMVRIRVITPEAVYFRTYAVPAVTDEVVAAALRSVEVPAAWVQGNLPLAPSPPYRLEMD